MKKAWLVVVALTVGAGTDAMAKRIRPPSVTGRVLKLEVSGGALLLTAGAGSEQGVEKTNTCIVLVDDKPADDVHCALVRVDKRTALVKTDLPLERKSPQLTVRFDPAR